MTLSLDAELTASAGGLLERARLLRECISSSDGRLVSTRGNAAGAACPVSGLKETLGGEEGAPVPFEEAIQLILWVASDMLETRAGALMQMLSPAAKHSLDRSLLKRLSLHAAPALLHEFDQMRPGVARVALRWLGGAPGLAADDRYRAFVLQLREDGWRGFLERYPVLARAVGTMVTFWVESAAEFLERLSQDLEQIASSFGLDIAARPGCVVSLDAGKSDPHHGGRTVLLFALAGGAELVYKPRDVSAEAAFRKFAEWCASENAPFGPVAPRVLCCRGYGWIERVRPEDLRAPQYAPAYYRRAGALLAVLHVLGATDAHHENVIASGAYPVFIDAETLLTPETGLPQPRGLAAARLARSVRRTGMLPMRIGSGEGLSYDVSALGGVRGKTPEIPVWKDVNTDAMRVEAEPARISDDYLPMLDGRPVPARGWGREIEDGFSAMYSWLVVRKPMLLNPEGPVSVFLRNPDAIRVAAHSRIRDDSACQHVGQAAGQRHRSRSSTGVAGAALSRSGDVLRVAAGVRSGT